MTGSELLAIIAVKVGKTQPHGNDWAVIDIRNLSVLEGRIPARALGLVIEWASQHRQELEKNWELA